MNEGWVKLHRKVLDHPRSNDPEWFSVWGHLMLLATHVDYRVVFKGETRTLKPGQLITSRDSLAKRCGISASKVERVLKWMENEHQIEQESSAVNRLITLSNWQTYQPSEQAIEHRPDTDRTPTGHRPDTNKNIKNSKNKRIEEAELGFSFANEATELVVPQNLRTQAFLGTWAEWVEFRKAKGGCKDWLRMLQKQLDWLGTFPTETALAILDQSMRNGWRGLFAIKDGKQPQFSRSEQARRNCNI